MQNVQTRDRLPPPFLQTSLCWFPTTEVPTLHSRGRSRCAGAEPGLGAGGSLVPLVPAVAPGGPYPALLRTCGGGGWGAVGLLYTCQNQNKFTGRIPERFCRER